MNTRQPLFGMIPYFGGGWSVQYSGDSHGTQSLSGYGEFPFDRFPNIPIVDCRTVESFKGFPSHPVEHYGRQSKWEIYPTLAEFLERAEQCGATVIRPKLAA